MSDVVLILEPHMGSTVMDPPSYNEVAAKIQRPISKSEVDMKRRTLLLITALMIFSGFIGGMVVHATQPTHIVVAEEFRLVDPDGNLRGRLYVDDEGKGQIELLPQGRKLDRGL